MEKPVKECHCEGVRNQLGPHCRLCGKKRNVALSEAIRRRVADHDRNKAYAHEGLRRSRAMVKCDHCPYCGDPL